jgi:2-polyprenyl-3-methyl-5-hydroxy-6-metoxy-1,4-benzoquinol methylase
MTQYDAIARDYQEITATVRLRAPEWYSLHIRLGDLTGLSVLDIACGEGMSSRRIKQWGAARVMGVDISAQMIGLAQQQERAQPLGIEYQVADAARLGKVGEFDRVTASYFLHYAQNREQLLGMAQTVYDNLKPGQLFVASNINPHHLHPPFLDNRKYGFTSRLVDDPLREWSKIRFTLFDGDKTVEFDTYWIPWTTYEEVFQTVGFRSWKVEPYLIPPDLERKYGEGFWDEYTAAPSLIHFTCQK